SRKPCGHPINQYCYLVSQLKCPKFCVIAHDLSLKAFNLQSIHLSSYYNSFYEKGHKEQWIFGGRPLLL
ncbi:MAG: hypothetical protein MUO88_20970, partial [Desulfobacterales bacterium]|nr:hypothetical protein [Desulfobacterales bacterium]